MDKDQMKYIETDVVSNFAKYTTEASKNDNPTNDLDYRNSLSTPKSRDIFPDINQDVQLANLDGADIIYVTKMDEIIADLESIKAKYNLGEQNQINDFRRKRDFKLAVSLSKDGKLRSWLHENRSTISIGKQNNSNVVPKTKIRIPGFSNNSN